MPFPSSTAKATHAVYPSDKRGGSLLIKTPSGRPNFVLWIYASLPPGIMPDWVDRSYRIKRIV